MHARETLTFLLSERRFVPMQCHPNPGVSARMNGGKENGGTANGKGLVTPTEADAAADGESGPAGADHPFSFCISSLCSSTILPIPRPKQPSTSPDRVSPCPIRPSSRTGGLPVSLRRPSSRTAGVSPEPGRQSSSPGRVSVTRRGQSGAPAGVSAGWPRQSSRVGGMSPTPPRPSARTGGVSPGSGRLSSRVTRDSATRRRLLALESTPSFTPPDPSAGTALEAGGRGRASAQPAAIAGRSKRSSSQTKKACDPYTNHSEQMVYSFLTVICSRRHLAGSALADICHPPRPGEPRPVPHQSSCGGGGVFAHLPRRSPRGNWIPADPGDNSTPSSATRPLPRRLMGYPHCSSLTPSDPSANPPQDASGQNENLAPPAPLVGRSRRQFSWMTGTCDNSINYSSITVQVSLDVKYIQWLPTEFSSTSTTFPGRPLVTHVTSPTHQLIQLNRFTTPPEPLLTLVASKVDP